MTEQEPQRTETQHTEAQHTEAQRTERYDVVVVGGGAAGLSAALTLGRARRSVLVVDAGQQRNAPASHVHNYLTRDGTPPAELLAAAREEVTGYGVRIVTGRVDAARRLDEDGTDFRVTLSDGSTVAARRLLVATGLVDELPDVPGVAERWGRDVLHCPYCHGWEVRDQAIGVLGTGPLAVHQALMWRQWSAEVTLFLHTAPEPGDEEYEQLAARGIAVVDGKVAGLEVTGDRLSGVRLADGPVRPCQALVVAPRFTARSGLLAALGVEAGEQEVAGHVVGSQVAAEPTGATAVPGVWVAGNVASVQAQVVGAADAGVRAGAAVNAELSAEETRRAVAARQRGESETVRFWEEFYGTIERKWSWDPNPVLAREVADLTPGTALDLGCGEGADAVWLARQGWRVTAADVSRTALERGARHAEDAGVGERVDWQEHDLGASFPEGVFDLVSAQFLHSPVELPWERILRAGAAAVAPGGVLLVVGHGEQHPDPALRFPAPGEVLDVLGLAEREWRVERGELLERTLTGPDGQPVTHTDSVVRVRRLVTD